MCWIYKQKQTTGVLLFCQITRNNVVTDSYITLNGCLYIHLNSTKGNVSYFLIDCENCNLDFS